MRVKNKKNQANKEQLDKKLPTKRLATAQGHVSLPPSVYALVASNAVNKGDVLTVAKLAGGLAATSPTHVSQMLQTSKASVAPSKHRT